MGSLMDREVLPRPSIHFVAHVSPLHGIVKLDPDYSGVGLSSRCVDSIPMPKSIILDSSHALALALLNEFMRTSSYKTSAYT